MRNTNKINSTITDTLRRDLWHSLRKHGSKVLTNDIRLACSTSIDSNGTCLVIPVIRIRLHGEWDIKAGGVCAKRVATRGRDDGGSISLGAGSGRNVQALSDKSDARRPRGEASAGPSTAMSAPPCSGWWGADLWGAW